MVILQAALAQMGPYGDHMDWDDGPSWWMVTIMAVFGILLVALVVMAIVYMARHTSTTGPVSAAQVASPSTATSSARAILDERLARGEIDVAEYEERRRALDQL